MTLLLCNQPDLENLFLSAVTNWGFVSAGGGCYRAWKWTPNLMGKEWINPLSSAQTLTLLDSEKTEL